MTRPVFFFLILIVLGCSHYRNKEIVTLPTHGAIKLMKRNDSIPTVSLFPNKAEEYYLFTDLKDVSGFDGIVPNLEYEYIALDNSIGYIGEVKNILFIKDRIIIHDGSVNDVAVFIFTMEGVGIKRIKAGGRGPSEFLGIAQIFTFPGADYFVVKDDKSSRFQYFDLNGEYIKTEHTMLHISACMPINDSVLVSGSSYRQNYHIEDLVEYSIYSGVKDSIIYKGLPYKHYQKTFWAVNSFFTNYRGDIQIRQHASDSIYQILNDSTYFVPYVVKFDKSVQQKFESMPVETNFDELYWEYTTKSGYQDILSFLENDNCIHYICGLGDGLRYGYLYDKQNNKTYKFSTVFPAHPIKLLYTGEAPVTIHENKFVAAIPGYKIFNGTKRNLVTYDENGNIITEVPVEYDESVAHIVENINENSNPVLMLYRFEFN